MIIINETKQGLSDHAWTLRLGMWNSALFGALWHQWLHKVPRGLLEKWVALFLSLDRLSRRTADLNAKRVWICCRAGQPKAVFKIWYPTVAFEPASTSSEKQAAKQCMGREASIPWHTVNPFRLINNATANRIYEGHGPHTVKVISLYSYGISAIGWVEPMFVNSSWFKWLSSFEFMMSQSFISVEVESAAKLFLDKNHALIWDAKRVNHIRFVCFCVPYEHYVIDGYYNIL